jgi:hypothetical protein
MKFTVAAVKFILSFFLFPLSFSLTLVHLPRSQHTFFPLFFSFSPTFSSSQMPHHLTSSQVKTSASKFDETHSGEDETHSAVKTKPIPVKTNASNRRLFEKIEDEIGTHLCRGRWRVSGLEGF